MPFVRIIFCLVAASLIFAFVSGANPAYAQKPSPTSNLPTPTVPIPQIASAKQLTSDKRLQQSVSLDTVGVSIGELLSQYNTPALKFTCSKDCIEQKLQIRLKNRPLSSLLLAISDLLPGNWVVTPTGYRLEMTPEARRYRARWWGTLQNARQSAMNDMANNLIDTMRMPLEIDDRIPEEDRAAVENAMQHRAFFHDLPQDAQTQIANQIADSIYFCYGTNSIVELTREGATELPFDSLSPRLQGMARQGLAELQGVNYQMGSLQSLRFYNSGADISVGIVNASGKAVDTGLTMFVSEPPPPVLALEHRDLVSMLQSLGRKPDSNEKILIDYQKRYVWENSLPTNVPFQFVPPRRSEVLDWLSRQDKFEFVADFYSSLSAPLPTVKPTDAADRPLAEELNLQAVKQDMSWKQRSDGLYLFRHNRWYRNDFLEVPNKTLQSFYIQLPPAIRLSPKEREKQKKEENLSPEALLKQQMDLGAAVVTKVTPFQMANGLSCYVSEKVSQALAREEDYENTAVWRPFHFISENVLIRRRTYQFYALLSEEKRAYLLKGKLPLSSLTVEEKQSLDFILPRGQASSELFVGISAVRPIGYPDLINGSYNTPRNPEDLPFAVTLTLASPPKPD